MGQAANPGVSVRDVCRGQSCVSRGTSTLPPPPQRRPMCGVPVPAPHHLWGATLQAKEGRVSVRAMLQDEATLGGPKKPVTSPARCP